MRSKLAIVAPLLMLIGTWSIPARGEKPPRISSFTYVDKKNVHFHAIFWELPFGMDEFEPKLGSDDRAWGVLFTADSEQSDQRGAYWKMSQDGIVNCRTKRIRSERGLDYEDKSGKIVFSTKDHLGLSIPLGEPRPITDNTLGDDMYKYLCN